RVLLCVIVVAIRASPSPFPYSTLFRARRCGGARVGHEVGDREVDLVAHGRDDRDRRRRDRPRRYLLVECPQVLERDNGEGDRGEIGKHTSELQSRVALVCRLLLEKKKG